MESLQSPRIVQRVIVVGPLSGVPGSGLRREAEIVGREGAAAGQIPFGAERPVAPELVDRRDVQDVPHVPIGGDVLVRRAQVCAGTVELRVQERVRNVDDRVREVRVAVREFDPVGASFADRPHRNVPDRIVGEVAGRYRQRIDQRYRIVRVALVEAFDRSARVRVGRKGDSRDEMVGGDVSQSVRFVDQYAGAVPVSHRRVGRFLVISRDRSAERPLRPEVVREVQPRRKLSQRVVHFGRIGRSVGP